MPGLKDALTDLLIWWAILLIPSMIAAELASGGRGTWLWGIVGPAGWIVAALRGVHIRLEDALPEARPAPEPEVRYHAAPALRGARRRRRRERERAAREAAAADDAPVDVVATEEPPEQLPDEPPPET